MYNMMHVNIYRQVRKEACFSHYDKGLTQWKTDSTQLSQINPPVNLPVNHAVIQPRTFRIPPKAQLEKIKFGMRLFPHSGL